MTEILMAPAYALRQYTWAVLKSNDPETWKETNYEGLIPIVPLSEEPELSEFNGPRIVYDFTYNRTGVSYFRGRGVMTFVIRDNNFRRMTKTMNILQETFNRLDDSARDVNYYLDKVSVPFDVSFGTIAMEFGESGTPEEDEGGRMVSIVSISFDYYMDHSSVNTRPIP